MMNQQRRLFVQYGCAEKSSIPGLEHTLYRRQPDQSYTAAKHAADGKSVPIAFADYSESREAIAISGCHLTATQLRQIAGMMDATP
jgi:hypothetical protein